MQAPPLDVLVIGEALVDFVPLHRGPLREAEGFELHSGGAPSNVAIGVSRLGARAGLISVVGGDEFGRFLLRSLAIEGVDASAVRVVPGQQTGLCFITLDRDGERSFLHRGGEPALLLAPSDVDPAQAMSARAVKFSVGPLRTESGVAAVRKLVEHARGLVTCDPGACPVHWGAPDVMAARFYPLIERCDVFKCAAEEASFLTDEADPAAAAKALVKRGVRLAVVTVGAAGAVWARAADAGHVPAPVVQVVDTTGAGDAFMAALLTRLTADPTHPADLSAAAVTAHLAFACAKGAEAVTRRGAVPARQERVAHNRSSEVRPRDPTSRNEAAGIPEGISSAE